MREYIHKDPLHLNGSSSNSEQNEYGGTANIPIGMVIASILITLFVVITARTIYIIHPAFKNAYKHGLFTSDSVERSDDRSMTSDEIQFHTAYFSPEVIRWERHIQSWASDANLPPDLVAVVMQIESCGDPLARSSSGALGIFQVMPFHFHEGEDPFDPEINARRGLAYLSKGLERGNGQVDLALAGYNGGHSLINLEPDAWPEETRRYVQWGAGIWEDIQSQHIPSPTLENWLNAGGAHLCMQASARAYEFSQPN